MIGSDKIIKAVCDHFDVTTCELSGKSRQGHLAMARRILIHLLDGRDTDMMSKVINRAKCQVYKYRAEMNRDALRDKEVIEHLTQINLKIHEMKIKLNRTQVGSLWELLETFLTLKPESVTLALLCLHLDDIKESARKRFLSGKENIGLDDKQVKAFQIWYFHFGAGYEDIHPHGHMTLIDMISQIKPLVNERTITFKT